MQEQDFIIRPLNSGDLDWLIAGADFIGPGFTSLPNNKEFIARRVELVEQSFQEKIPPEKRIYLFVREDYPSKERIGISGMQANIGYGEAFYNYQISTLVQSSREINKMLEHRILNLVNDFQHASEVISFWIHPKFRGHHEGKYLSLMRFLFVAQHRFLFGEQFVAEVRGVCDENGYSPFWEALGRHFYDMDFAHADSLTLTLGKQFIADLNPHEPIYLDLLPQDALNVVGVEHPHATAARKLLESEGFEYHNYIDIFDAGPLINVETSKIRTLAHSKLASIAKIVPHVSADAEKVFIYNCKVLEARFTRAHIFFNENSELIISEKTAELLDVAIGAMVRYAPIIKD